MRILVTGASGMLGHKLYQHFADKFEVFGCIRGDFASIERFGIFDESTILCGVDARDGESIRRCLADVRPDWVVNAVGVIKQVANDGDSIESLLVNAVFPRQLKLLSQKFGYRLITVSTDCVFDGARGMYSEADDPTAVDIYGISKFLGEVDGQNCLTLRTSIIGRELGTSHSIVEWFLAQSGGTVSGYRNAIYSGFSTIEMARVIAGIIRDHKDLAGIYNVSSEPISKFELLNLLDTAYKANVRIEPSDDLVIDRSLESSKFRLATGYAPPDWPAMVKDMAADPTPYTSF